MSCSPLVRLPVPLGGSAAIHALVGAIACNMPLLAAVPTRDTAAIWSLVVPMSASSSCLVADEANVGDVGGVGENKSGPNSSSSSDGNGAGI